MGPETHFLYNRLLCNEKKITHVHPVDLKISCLRSVATHFVPIRFIATIPRTPSLIYIRNPLGNGIRLILVEHRLLGMPSVHMTFGRTRDWAYLIGAPGPRYSRIRRESPLHLRLYPPQRASRSKEEMRLVPCLRRAGSGKSGDRLFQRRGMPIYGAEPRTFWVAVTFNIEQ